MDEFILSLYPVNYTQTPKGLSVPRIRTFFRREHNTMKNILFAALLFFTCSRAFSQDYGVWREGDTTGFTPRFALTSAVLNGKIYVMGGNESGKITPGVNNSNRLEMYDPSSNSWTTPKTTGTFTPRQYLGSAAVQGKIYIIGGTGGANGNEQDKVEIFDPLYNSLAPAAKMPTARSALTIAVIKDKIYAIGGINPLVSATGFLSTLEVFDPLAGASGTWSTPVTAGWFHPMARTTSAVVNDKIYVIGGYDGFSTLDSVFVFDPASNSWTALVTTGYFTPRQRLTSSVLNNKIYVFGGEDDNGNPLDTVEVFDPANNSWDSVITKDSMTARYALTASAVGNSIYVLGGTPDQESVYNLNEIFRPSTSGVEQGKIIKDISISPNPADRFISVHGENITHIAIIDMLGRSVVENNYPLAADITLDLSGLPEGIYYAECIGKDFITVKKIVKIK